MKIGILTYHSPYNFGANLQVYSTSRIFENYGFEVKIIDYQRIETQNLYRGRVSKQQWQGHDNFIETNLNLTVHASTENELLNIVKEENFQGIIVGADAIWSFYPFNRPDIPVYFMQWFFSKSDLNEIPIVSMSVANMTGGFKNVSLENRIELNECISKFSFLSVRDVWTKNNINKYIFNGKKKIEIINSDPVFCLDKYIKEEWKYHKILDKNEKFFLITFPQNSNNKYNSWLTEFKKVAHANGYLVGELPLPEGNSGLKFDFTVPYPIDPVQWFLWLKNSNGFIGLRFHAIVSCITCGTPFFSIDSYGNFSFFIRVVNKLGFYQIGRLFDHRSKIFQLLDKTKFKSNRVNSNGILGISPKFIFEKLSNTNINDILELKNNFLNLFQKNLGTILNIFNKNTCK